MPTLLPPKNLDKTPLATDDDHHEALVADPTVDHTELTCPVTPVPVKPATQGFGGFNSSFGSGSAVVSPGGFGSPSPTMGGMTGQNTQASTLQSTGGAMQEGAQTLIKTDDKFGHFINSKWRPMMALIYMITCFTDFVLFPVLWSALQAVSHGSVTTQWMPLTLQGAGLYHIAMGAILGIAAYGRSQEKMAGKA